MTGMVAGGKETSSYSITAGPVTKLLTY